MELIKQQRLNRLCEGTCFRKISSRRRQGEARGGGVIQPPPARPRRPSARFGLWLRFSGTKMVERNRDVSL